MSRDFDIKKQAFFTFASIMAVKHWIEAFRLRTLPLALACIGMGTFLAAFHNQFNGWVLGLCISTTVFLQVLSNLANDYGDTENGADSEDRKGPLRAVQTGVISKSAMKKAILIFVVFSLISGIALLLMAFGLDHIKEIALFFVLGLLSIAAAIKYTAGKNPYGYMGLGDISVFLFFGVVGVCGSCFLFTKSFSVDLLLPAMSVGFLSTGVLNVNNIRDIESDKKAGKNSIPVRIGGQKARVYHTILVLMSLLSLITYTILNCNDSLWQWLFLISSPLFVINVVGVWKNKEAMEIDPYLKQLALSTTALVILFGIGLLLGK